MQGEPLVCDLIEWERRRFRGDVLHLLALDGREIDLVIGRSEANQLDKLRIAPGLVDGVGVTLVTAAKGYFVNSFWRKGR